MPHRATQGDIGVSWGAGGVGKQMSQKPLLWLLWEGTGIGEARVVGLGLV